MRFNGVVLFTWLSRHVTRVASCSNSPSRSHSWQICLVLADATENSCHPRRARRTMNQFAFGRPGPRRVDDEDQCQGCSQPSRARVPTGHTVGTHSILGPRNLLDKLTTSQSTESLIASV